MTHEIDAIFENRVFVGFGQCTSVVSLSFVRQYVNSMPILPAPKDVCPCESGLKFQECCRPKIEAAPRINGLQVFPERFVVGRLLASSPSFSAFYETERPKIADLIRWVEDPSIEPLSGQVDREPDGPVIALGRILPPTQAAPTVAEELAHLVLDAEGFPGTRYRDPYGLVSRAINDLVHDPLIHSRLARHGFDMVTVQKRKNERARVRRTKRPPTSQSDLVFAIWAMNYAQHVLEWEAITHDNDVARGSQFREWFESRFPAITQEGRDLLDLVRQVGFDTPQKTESLIRAIIDRYSLTGKVDIETRP